MISTSATVDRTAFEQRTGWQLKPEGACKGEVCIPLADPPTGDTIDLASIADQMGMALVHDADHGVWALGPEALGGRALATAEAPNLTLPQLDGSTFELASLRGKKVFLYAWSPY